MHAWMSPSLPPPTTATTANLRKAALRSRAFLKSAFSLADVEIDDRSRSAQRKRTKKKGKNEKGKTTNAENSAGFANNVDARAWTADTGVRAAWTESWWWCWDQPAAVASHRREQGAGGGKFTLAPRFYSRRYSCVSGTKTLKLCKLKRVNWLFI